MHACIHTCLSRWIKTKKQDMKKARYENFLKYKRIYIFVAKVWVDFLIKKERKDKF